MTEANLQQQQQGVKVEREMATHCSVLAWRIPGMGGGAWWADVYGVTWSQT